MTKYSNYGIVADKKQVIASTHVNTEVVSVKAAFRKRILPPSRREGRKLAIVATQLATRDSRGAHCGEPKAPPPRDFRRRDRLNANQVLASTQVATDDGDDVDIAVDRLREEKRDGALRKTSRRPCSVNQFALREARDALVAADVQKEVAVYFAMLAKPWPAAMFTGVR